MTEGQVRTGVVGVGSMGQNHARVYEDLESTTLVGVADADEERAESVAADRGVDALDVDALLGEADAVSVAVPTEYHADFVERAIDAGVGVLVEKPFVDDVATGRELVKHARQQDVTLQVGHVERFNPAVDALRDVLEGLDVVAVNADRLSPPPGRDLGDTAVMDLMSHDIDLVRTLFEGDVASCGAFGTDDGEYAVGTLQLDTGVLCNLTASRVTQEDVRRLTVSARSCRVKADLLDQTVEVHREASPSVVGDLDDVDARGEDVVEHLSVAAGEPLARELRSFADAVRTGDDPRVTGEDGLRVLEIARAFERRRERNPVVDPGEPTPT